MERTADPWHASCVRTCRATGRGPLIAVVRALRIPEDQKIKNTWVNRNRNRKSKQTDNRVEHARGRGLGNSLGRNPEFRADTTTSLRTRTRQWRLSGTRGMPPALCQARSHAAGPLNLTADVGVL